MGITVSLELSLVILLQNIHSMRQHIILGDTPARFECRPRLGSRSPSHSQPSFRHFTLPTLPPAWIRLYKKRFLGVTIIIKQRFGNLSTVLTLRPFVIKRAGVPSNRRTISVQGCPLVVKSQTLTYKTRCSRQHVQNNGSCFDTIFLQCVQLYKNLFLDTYQDQFKQISDLFWRFYLKNLNFFSIWSSGSTYLKMYAIEWVSGNE